MMNKNIIQPKKKRKSEINPNPSLDLTYTNILVKISVHPRVVAITKNNDLTPRD